MTDLVELLLKIMEPRNMKVTIDKSSRTPHADLLRVLDFYGDEAVTDGKGGVIVRAKRRHNVTPFPNAQLRQFGGAMKPGGPEEPA